MKKKICFPLWDTTQQRFILIFELKYFQENKFFSKMILTHESVAQEDQFDGKKEGQNSRGTIPLSIQVRGVLSRQNTV
jgi:hypothetical protein